MIAIRINNNTYKSISEAWRELSPEDLPEITVRWRLKNNWNKYEAFTFPAVPPVERRTFPGDRSSSGSLSSVLDDVYTGI